MPLRIARSLVGWRAAFEIAAESSSICGTRNFSPHTKGEHDLNTSGGIVRERKHVDGDRLIVQLDYPDGSHEEFEWQLFESAQMKRLAVSLGLVLLISCSDFDMTTLPSPTNPRIQFLLERTRESLDGRQHFRARPCSDLQKR